MAGTLITSTIQGTTLTDGTNSTSTTNCIQGSAKAWVNFNGVTTATTRSSYNVTSVTRNATGDYTILFTDAFVDANYTMAGSYEGLSAPGALFPYASGGTGTAPTLVTTTQYRMRTTGPTDAFWVSAVFHR
jgi:hypothetical protein